MPKHAIVQIMPYDNLRTLVVWCQRSWWNYDGVILTGGAKWAWTWAVSVTSCVYVRQNVTC